MKPILFIGDSHLGRTERIYGLLTKQSPQPKAEFLCLPGPTSNMINFAPDGRLTLRVNRDYLAKHPLAAQHDFMGWMDLVEEKYADIEDRHGLTPDCYSAICIVSFQLFNPENWVESTLKYVGHEISRQAWTISMQENYILNHGMKKTMHITLLDQATAAGWVRKYSASTPARSSAAPFPSPLVRDSGDIGAKAFALAENALAERLQLYHGSIMLRYPQALMSSDGITTDAKFQQNPNDFTHLNDDGSRIYLESMLMQIQESERLSIVDFHAESARE